MTDSSNNKQDYQLLNMTVGNAVDRAADLWGNQTGWVFENQSVTFSEMRDKVDQAARALIHYGIQPGDVVGVWMPNLVEFAIIQFACAKVGAIVAPINTRSKEFEVAHFLETGRPRLLFIVEQFLKHDFIGILEQLASDQSADFPLLVSVSETPSPKLLSWENFYLQGGNVEQITLKQRQDQRSMGEAMLLQYTSGTTSLPKGALINHQYVLNFGGALLHRMNVGAGTPFFNTQPFYHVGGSCGALTASLALGCKVICPEYYEVERVLTLIEREKCVARSGYGAMYIMEMSHPRFKEYDLSSLQTAWCVGTPALMARVRDEMQIPGLLQIYGSTEAGSTSAWLDDSWTLRSESCGSPITGMEIRISDPETRHPLSTGEVGEIAIRGWCTMNGYHNDPVETARVVDANGWVYTGDMGYVDENDNLFFSSRLKDMLKIGGENVSATEVEGILLTHPGVAQVAVIGVPDERLSEVVMAIIEPRTGHTLDEQEIIDFCRPKMANFRVPRYVRFVNKWPQTESGKIQKHKLREQYVATHEH